MIPVQYRKVTWLYIHIWILTLLHAETKKGTKCSSNRNYKWRLSGGLRGYEGMIEVDDGDTRYNVCADRIDSDKICSKLNRTTGYVTLHRSNVFKADLQNETITFRGGCLNTRNKERTCDTEQAADCCQPAGICCSNMIIGELCSGNWSATKKTKCHYKMDGDRVTYGQVRVSLLDGTNKDLAWTLSALGVLEQGCPENESLSRDVVRNCTNRCINKQKFTNVFVNSNGGCSCSDNDVKTQSQNGCYKLLEVVNSSSESTEFCLAAEVVSGTKRFTAEDCDRFLQPLCVKTEARITVVTHNGMVHKSSTPTNDPDSGSVSVLTSTLVVIAALILVACITTLICKCSQKKSDKDPVRHNSAYNRTYDRQVRKSDEEYAIISEIELDSGTTIYKPPLPERSSPGGNTYHMINYGKDTSTAAIVTLDDYSTPSDVITNKHDVDLAAEYSTTYDDPIRHNEENMAEIKRKSETNESSSSEQLTSDIACDKRFSKSETPVNLRNITSSKSHEQLINAKTNTSVPNGLSSDNEKFGEEHDEGSRQTNYSDANNPHGYFVLEPDSMKKGKGEAHDVKSCCGDNADANVIAGNFSISTKTTTCEEHVCLDCLKPEHLKKLGIRLIPETHLDECKKRLSEPLYRTYGDAIEAYNRLKCKADVTQTDTQSDMITFIESKSLGENRRTCVECNNVYDKLGRLKETVPIGYLRNEYNRIGSVQKQTSENTLADTDTR